MYMSYVYTYKTPISITIGEKISILANEPFYIGKGTNNRWKDHITQSRLRSKYQNWMKLGVLRHIKEAGLDPLIEFNAVNLNDDMAFNLEKDLLQKYGRICDGTGVLTNLTLGGEGASGFIPSQKTREIWSKQRKGKTPANKGIKRPKVGGRPSGVLWSEQEREAHRIANQKSNCRDSHKTSEYRKKMSNLKMGCSGSAKDKFWFNNGSKETYSFECPLGFIKGRLPRKQIGKRGLVWYNNGNTNRQFLENEQEDGFIRGRIFKK